MFNYVYLNIMIFKNNSLLIVIIIYSCLEHGFMYSTNPITLPYSSPLKTVASKHFMTTRTLMTTRSSMEGFPPFKSFKKRSQFLIINLLINKAATYMMLTTEMYVLEENLITISLLLSFYRVYKKALPQFSVKTSPNSKEEFRYD